MSARQAVVAACLLGLVLLAGCSGAEESTADEAQPGETPADESTGEEHTEEQPPSEEQGTEDQEASVVPLGRTNIEVYFPSASRNGLVGEFREIFNTVTPGDRAKQIIGNLIEGPSSGQALRAVPPGVRLRQAFVMHGGTVYLDFTSELTEGIRGGSMSEMMTVYSIIDSVALNIREIRRVGILVNGRPLETLNGHLDLRRPLPPDTSLILGSIIVEGSGRSESKKAMIATALSAPEPAE